jgi:alginate O-acetyltransferase complex protein AlgI
MLFNSISYWVFLPVIVCFYFMLKHKYRWVLLLAASYLFYASWNFSFVIFILVSTLVDYWVGLKMGKLPDKKARKIYLYFSLLVNLGMLFFFKYLGFFNEIGRSIFGLFEGDYPIDTLDILLPIGISFYTFQTLSYTIDVYRGNRKPEPHLGIFALYVSFFPQLVSGPIERSKSFLPQFHKPTVLNWQRIIDGGKLILWGLFKKMVIADNLSIFIQNVYGSPEEYSGNIMLLAMFSVGVQIYCDFSGYTDIAIGSAKLFGINLSKNFDRPLFASSMTSLWAKWHITLTRWIRDYMALPLRGILKSKVSSYVLLYIVFVSIGLWHGASWQFAVFGVLHATYLAVEKLSFPIRKVITKRTGLDKIPKVKNGLGVLITFTLFAFSGIFFAHDDFDKSVYIVSNLFSGGEIMPYLSKMNFFYPSNVFVIISSLIVFWWIEFNNRTDLTNPFSQINNKVLRWATYVFIVFYLIIFKVNENVDFFYFQF